MVGPMGFTTTTHEMEVKPASMAVRNARARRARLPDKITFIEVVKPERLV